MMTRTSFKRACLAGSAALVAVAGLSAPSSAAIEEIIVTAQKRAQNIQDVPISMSTMDGASLENIFENGEDVLALAARIPSLYVESSNGRVAPRFYIRGLGNTDFDLAASQPVSVYIDDVIMENVVLKSTPLFDVSQVEVLRGPQGSLFGRNTSAGIVKFDTNNPTFEWEHSLKGSYGTYGSSTVQGVVSGPLADKVAARVAVHFQDRDDWIDNSFTGQDDVMGGFSEMAVRVKLLWEPADSTSILFTGHHRELEGTAAIFRANILGPNGLTQYFDRDVVAFDEGANNPQMYDGAGYSVRIDHEFDQGVSVTYIGAREETSGSSRGDIDGGNLVDSYAPYIIPFPSDTKDGIDDLEQTTHELRFASQGTVGYSWQFGGYLFDSEYQITTNPYFVAPSTLIHSNQAWAVFGQGSWDAGEDVVITAGLRYTNEEKGLHTVASPIPQADVSIEDDQVSWDVSMTWAYDETTNFYGRIASGYRGPSIQGRDVAFFGSPSTADSETNLSFEIGSKSELFNDRLRLNMAVYKYQVEDLQVSAVGGAGNLIQLVNLDKAKGQGFEVDAEYIVFDGLSVTLGYSWNDTEIDDPNLLVGICGSAQCTVTDPTVFVGPDEFAVVDGNPLPQAPDHILNLVVDYRAPAFDGHDFFFTGDLTYEGQKNLFLYEAKEFGVDGQYELGFRAGIAEVGGRYEIAIFGRNITDQENIKGAIDFNNNTGFVNDPRILGISFTGNF